MILKETIETIVFPKLEEDGYFPVEVKISPSNKIIITIDSFDGVPIAYIVELSRYVDASLDREVEDFELEVSSAGLSLPFVVYKQYQKHEGKDVEVVTKDGLKHAGVMTLVCEKSITLQVSSLEKIEGKKKKQEVVKDYEFPFENINSTKLVITFK